MSQTLKTLSRLMMPSKPDAVAYRLLSAYRISPSAVKMMASIPSSLALSFSASITCFKRRSTSESVSFVNRTIAQRDWIGSMILLESLHARANLVVALNSVITIRRACYALAVSESASSRMISLCIPGGTVTF